jgi:hypothetical protein
MNMLDDLFRLFDGGSDPFGDPYSDPYGDGGQSGALPGQTGAVASTPTTGNPEVPA